MENILYQFYQLIKPVEAKAESKPQRKKRWLLSREYLQPLDEPDDEEDYFKIGDNPEEFCRKTLLQIYKAAKYGMKEGVLTGVFLGGSWGIFKYFNDEGPVSKNRDGDTVIYDKEPTKEKTNTYASYTILEDGTKKYSNTLESTFTEANKKLNYPAKNDIQEYMTDYKKNLHNLEHTSLEFLSKNEGLVVKTKMDRISPDSLTLPEINKFGFINQRDKVEIVGYAFIQTTGSLSAANSDDSTTSVASNNQNKIVSIPRKESVQKQTINTKTPTKINKISKKPKHLNREPDPENYPSDVFSSVPNNSPPFFKHKTRAMGFKKEIKMKNSERESNSFNIYKSKKLSYFVDLDDISNGFISDKFDAGVDSSNVSSSDINMIKMSTEYYEYIKESTKENELEKDSPFQTEKYIERSYNHRPYLLASPPVFSEAAASDNASKDFSLDSVEDEIISISSLELSDVSPKTYVAYNNEFTDKNTPKKFDSPVLEPQVYEKHSLATYKKVERESVSSILNEPSSKISDEISEKSNTDIINNEKRVNSNDLSENNKQNLSQSFDLVEANLISTINKSKENILTPATTVSTKSEANEKNAEKFNNQKEFSKDEYTAKNSNSYVIKKKDQAYEPEVATDIKSPIKESSISSEKSPYSDVQESDTYVKNQKANNVSELLFPKEQHLNEYDPERSRSYVIKRKERSSSDSTSVINNRKNLQSVKECKEDNCNKLSTTEPTESSEIRSPNIESTNYKEYKQINFKDKRIMRESSPLYPTKSSKVDQHLIRENHQRISADTNNPVGIIRADEFKNENFDSYIIKNKSKTEAGNVKFKSKFDEHKNIEPQKTKNYKQHGSDRSPSAATKIQGTVKNRNILPQSNAVYEQSSPDTSIQGTERASSDYNSSKPTVTKLKNRRTRFQNASDSPQGSVRENSKNNSVSGKLEHHGNNEPYSNLKFSSKPSLREEYKQTQTSSTGQTFDPENIRLQKNAQSQAKFREYVTKKVYDEDSEDTDDYNEFKKPKYNFSPEKTKMVEPKRRVSNVKNNLKITPTQRTETTNPCSLLSSLTENIVVVSACNCAVVLGVVCTLLCVARASLPT